jgi:hypothetical protein
MSRVGLGDKFRNAVVSIVANGEISGSQLKVNVVNLRAELQVTSVLTFVIVRPWAIAVKPRATVWNFCP